MENSSDSVLLEVSVLGYAANGAAYRTGVFRMVDEWSKQLAAAPNLNLTFTSLLDPRTALRTTRYLRNSDIAHSRFLPELSAAVALGEVDAFYLELSRNRDVSLPKKILRRGLKELLQAWDRSTSLSPSLVSGPGIFHATYWPLPEGVRRGSQRRILMTFVDLINLVNAELSTDKGAFFRSVLDTVQTEDFTVSISEATRRDLLSVRPDLDPKRSFVAPLAASDTFCPVGSTALLEERLARWALRPNGYILSVGTLERRKNLPALLEAFEKWVEEVQDKETLLVLTGASGNSLEAIRSRLASSQVRDRVRLLGFVDDKELAPLYEGALVFAYPSLHEGFGLPVLEALSCGAVVVTSDNSSLPEVAGKAAFYCDAKKVDSIVEALKKAAAADSERPALRAAAIQRASEFSWKKSADVLLGIYRQMQE